MRRFFFILMVIFLFCSRQVFSQKIPTGNPKDFKIKTCLHSVSYAGFWRGQARLCIDDFPDKAKELGFDGGGDIENLDKTAKNFLDYVKDFKHENTHSKIVP